MISPRRIRHGIRNMLNRRLLTLRRNDSPKHQCYLCLTRSKHSLSNPMLQNLQQALFFDKQTSMVTCTHVCIYPNHLTLPNKTMRSMTGSFLESFVPSKNGDTTKKVTHTQCAFYPITRTWSTSAPHKSSTEDKRDGVSSFHNLISNSSMFLGPRWYNPTHYRDSNI